MIDVRDAVRGAIQRTLHAVENGIHPVLEGFKPQHAPVPPGQTPNAEAVELLKRAHEVLQSIEDHHVIGDFVHTEDPDLARLLSALEASVTPETHVKAKQPEGIIGWHKYDETDPHWLLCLVNELVRDKVPFIYPAKPTDFQVPLTDTDLVISICGDWGTDLMSSTNIENYMYAQNPDLMIHLGDVYYSGTEEEERKKLLKRFRGGTQGAFTLNSNHEMYSGGHGYFNVAIKTPPFSARQQASYFSLYNRSWQIIGLDSAYEADKRDRLYQHGWLGSEQIEWLQHQLENAAAANRRVILMTHHNPVDVTGGTDQRFLDQIIDAARYHPFHYWYFGHEHVGAVYRVFNWGGRPVYGRCIGHGGIPYPPQALGEQGNGIFVEWTEQERYAPDKGDPKCALNGFTVLKLPIAGGSLTESWYDDSGRLRYSGQYPQLVPTLSATRQPQASV